MVLTLIGKIVFIPFFHIFHRLKVKGKENIPKTGGAIVCANHVSNFDPIVVAICIKRNVHFMAKAELFKNKFVSYILIKLNAFPIKRGSADITAIKNSFKLIKNGEILGIFPEGTRSKNGKLGPAEPGTATIAIKTKAPIIPIKITGSYKAFKSVKVVIGKPIELTDYYDRKLTSDEINKASQQIMAEIDKLKY
jgi:1-acyl-sn-glycerol-3-phosphate acyltransferase